ncbi:hypothetical protein ACLESD_10825 [Pyxidicoccus sp. 3LFB2]
MSVPSWFLLSPVRASIEEVFVKTGNLRARHQFEGMEVAQLGRDRVSGRLEFQEDSVRSLRLDEDPLRTASAWDGLVVDYFSKSIRASLHLHFWKWGNSTGLGVEIDYQVPFVEPGGMAQGEWLERFMCSYVEDCGATACANGREWPYALEPLDPAQLVSRWRKEGLPQPPSRGFYMVTAETLNADDIALMRQRNDARANRWLRYFRTPTNYHVLSTWSRRDWWAV